MYGSTVNKLQNRIALLPGNLWRRANEPHRSVHEVKMLFSSSPCRNLRIKLLQTQRTPVFQWHANNHTSTSNIAPSAAAQHTQMENRKTIAKLLGVKEDEVGRIPMAKITEEKAQNTIDVLRKFGFTFSSVHLYPELLLMNGGAVENYIRIMQESGFPDIREVFIVRFRMVCKQSLSVLQKKVSLPSVSNVVERYCAELEEGDTFMEDFIANLPQETEKLTLFDLRSAMMGKYLGKLLLGTMNGSMDAFSKYPRLHYRSFNWIKANYNILKNFEFSNEKIKSHSYLLHTNPAHLTRVMSMKTLGGMEMKAICHHRPKILMSAYDTLMDIEQAFIEHNIPFEAIQKYPEVFTLSATTIRQRLEEMDAIPELKPLKTHHRVGRLIYYHTKAKSRLEEVRTMHLRTPSLHVLSSDKKRFNKSLASGDFRNKGVDVVQHLADIFQTDRKRIRKSLVCNPHWLYIPLVNIKKVLKFIQSVKSFESNQLIDALPILLYPIEKVEKEFANVITSGDARLEDKFFLQMILYYLERSSHFTGDAVWPEKGIPEEFDEEEGESNQRSNEVNI